MTWPTALVLGRGAEGAGRRALRGAGARGLLIVWDRAAERADDVLARLAEHPGPVVIAVPGLRDDEVDRLAVAVDEVIALTPPDEDYRAALREELAPLARSLTLLDEPAAPWWTRLGGTGGQATVALVAIIAGAMAVAVALGLVASALGRGAGVQGRADVAALAGAAALRDAQALLYSADPARRISVGEVRERAIRAARGTARANGLLAERIGFDGAANLPTRVSVSALTTGPRASDRRRRVRAVAEVAVGAGLATDPDGGSYAGPLAIRQGQRMRPDVALAFDRLNAAATADGRPLVIVSAFRSDAEQAALFAAHPDPKWVAPPGKSLHRLGTELDLGPSSAYGWLAANAKRFGFLQRYSWEAWHYGFVGSPGSASVGYRASSGGGGERATGALPSFVPAKYAGLIAKAAQRWSVGAALLGAQLWQESKFNPRAVSPVGAAGIAQFMPGTAAMYGLTPAERFDPTKAIDAQAHLMHDLLRQFAAVPLALAAYNAGPAPVQRCMCVPPFAETQGYVQSILALLGGAGIAAPNGLEIRLVA
ncbi:MAG: transglycosylase SLT domain-containing protein [Solirubrobacteraceae bacterium]|nr:transglycosylase SLT domain-containing protein [Solirubrobacteraceae bacterium]